MEVRRSFEVVAIGRNGEVQAELLRAQAESPLWLLSIETARWSFAFQLEAPETLSELLDFARLARERVTWAEWVAGSFAGAPVRVVTDDESADRLFLRVTGPAGLVEFTLQDEAFTAFVAALTQAVEELNGNP